MPQSNLPAVVVDPHTHTIGQVSRIFDIFKSSNGAIRPHFLLTGPSGSGKSHTIQMMCEDFDLDYMEVNAAQLTKEGISGNSLSKALSGLSNKAGPVVCFVDEFDKLFISGNNNSDLAHESTNGVQNEFLKVLESDTTSVFGDYGKYVNVSVRTVLFIFAGAFNGEPNIDMDKLREFGIKTEFLGRVGLVYNLPKVTLEAMFSILDKSKLMACYLKLFAAVDRDDVTTAIKDVLTDSYDKNTLGVRMINTLIHQYFINGGLQAPVVKQTTFQKTLSL